MKKILFATALSALAAQPSFAFNYDGCYQMWTPGALLPVICLAGTIEEGINGRGVRTALVRTNTDIVEWCGLTTASGGVSGSWTGDYDPASGLKKLTLTGEESGDVLLEFTTSSSSFGFFKLTEEQTGRLNAFNDKKCTDL